MPCRRGACLVGLSRRGCVRPPDHGPRHSRGPSCGELERAHGVPSGMITWSKCSCEAGETAAAARRQSFNQFLDGWTPPACSSPTHMASPPKPRPSLLHGCLGRTSPTPPPWLPRQVLANPIRTPSLPDNSTSTPRVHARTLSTYTQTKLSRPPHWHPRQS